MIADRFTKVLLTVIALELLWLGINTTRPVSAQGAATPVVITGIAIPGPGSAPAGTLPVSVAGSVVVETAGPLPIRSDSPIQVEADQPLPVHVVPDAPAVRPGV